jgi:hypothetical protein
MNDDRERFFAIQARHRRLLKMLIDDMAWPLTF